MRVRFALYAVGLLLLVAVSALPSHAQCITGTSNTPYLVFGPQAVGKTSLAQTATLTFSNSCGTAVTVNVSGTVTPTDAEFAVPDTGGSCPGFGPTIAGNSSVTCTLNVAFTPTVLGMRTATAPVNWTTNNTPPSATTTVNLIGGDEIVYVTTGVGGQVLTVDGANTNVFQVLSNGPGSAFNPTGAVVGPDGKIYMTDPVNSNIWRMNQDGSELEAVFNEAACTLQLEAPCPGKNPEGPSFSGSGSGDLYFNTFENGQGLFFIRGAATTPFNGTFNFPVNVEPGTCDACGSNGFPFGGTGTGFDASGNLLAADQEDSDIWSLSPPYDASVSAPTAILTSSTSTVRVSSSVVGIALNKANGLTYFAQSVAQQLVQIVPPVGAGPYTTTPYFTFTSSTPNCAATANTSDEPEYFEFDMTGHSFVATSTGPLNINFLPSLSGCGKVSRIDAVGPTATPLLDLNAAFTNGITNVCMAPCGLNSQQAIGLAMPPTQGQTQTVPLFLGGGSFTVGWPIGCTPTNTPGNNCSATWGITYPANLFANGDKAIINFNETSNAQYLANVAGTNYSTTTLAPVSGYNGGGLVPSVVCLDSSNMPCMLSFTGTMTYNIFTTWQSTQTTFCSLVPHLLQGDPVGGPYFGPNSFLADTIASCTDGGTGTSGRTSCTQTPSTKCLSDWPNSFGPTSNGTQSLTATAVITSPTGGSTFFSDQPVTESFNCGTSSILVSCNGTVTQPDGSIVTASNGGPLPTSQLGLYTIAVSPSVNGGTAVPASATYTVNGVHFVGFVAPVKNSPTVNVAKAGQAIPLGFQVLDSNGNPVTNLTLPPLSISIIPSSVACSGSSETLTTDDAAGSSGLQNLGGGNYQYNWKTPKSLAGMCERIQVGIGSTVALTADFQFK